MVGWVHAHMPFDVLLLGGWGGVVSWMEEEGAFLITQNCRAGR